MRQPPTYTSWNVTCHSPGEAQALQHWLSSRIDLDRVLTDTLRVTPNGAEPAQTVSQIWLGMKPGQICQAEMNDN